MDINITGMVEHGVDCIKQHSRDYYVNHPNIGFDAGKISVRFNAKDENGNNSHLTRTQIVNILKHWEGKLRAEHGYVTFSSMWAYGAKHLFYSRYTTVDIVV